MRGGGPAAAHFPGPGSGTRQIKATRAAAGLMRSEKNWKMSEKFVGFACNSRLKNSVYPKGCLHSANSLR
jgi:hypothetical protein